MDKMTIYNNLPIWAQNLACFYEGLKIAKFRYGDLFWQYLKEYEERSQWTYDQLCEYRDKRIQSIIKHSYNTVPYYKRLFDDGGINPDRIRTISDLKQIPILTKDIVNSRPKDFLSNAYSEKKMVSHHTSGTTGAGFVFKTTQEAINEQWAVWWRYRQALGIKYGTVSANFGTRFVVPVKQTKPPFWRYNKPCNQVYFSAFHENSENLKYYIEEMKRQKITWIHGYPSLISNLAEEVLSINDTSLKDQIKYVTIGAENLLEHQQKKIEEAFGVHIYQHYGLSEGVANISERPDKHMIIDEDFGAIEFVEEGDTHRIIATGLVNYAMPLIRWDTKDTASFFESSDGREVISIDGRIEDYLTLPNGRKIGKMDHVFKDAIHIKEVQIRQFSDYSIVVNIVPRDADYKEDIELVDKLMKETLGKKANYSFNCVDHIEKSKSGKLRFIISEIGKTNIAQ